MTPDIRQQIQAELSQLGPEDQGRVLEFVRTLGGDRRGQQLPPGTPGAELVRVAQVLSFSEEDLREIAEAIEEGCEQVDPREW